MNSICLAIHEVIFHCNSSFSFGDRKLVWLSYFVIDFASLYLLHMIQKKKFVLYSFAHDPTYHMIKLKRRAQKTWSSGIKVEKKLVFSFQKEM